jgi:hypothetical protein
MDSQNLLELDCGGKVDVLLPTADKTWIRQRSDQAHCPQVKLLEPDIRVPLSGHFLILAFQSASRHTGYNLSLREYIEENSGYSGQGDESRYYGQI